MYTPIVITIVSMLVGFALLVGINHSISRWDDRLRQRRAPVSFRRWLPTVRRVNDQVLEIAEYGSAPWDQVPALLMGGFMVVAIIVSLYPWPTLTYFSLAIAGVVFTLVAALFISLWMRSRHTYYTVDLNSGQLQKQTRTFGWPGRTTNHLLKLPVQARSDCQPRNVERRSALLRYATCWTLKNGQRLLIVHRSDEEAQQFRAELVQHGCPVVEPVPTD